MRASVDGTYACVIYVHIYLHAWRCVRQPVCLYMVSSQRFFDFTEFKFVHVINLVPQYGKYESSDNIASISRRVVTHIITGRAHVTKNSSIAQGNQKLAGERGAYIPTLSI